MKSGSDLTRKFNLYELTETKVAGKKGYCDDRNYLHRRSLLLGLFPNLHLNLVVLLRRSVESLITP
jgi:hypothetical protein